MVLNLIMFQKLNENKKKYDQNSPHAPNRQKSYLKEFSENRVPDKNSSMLKSV